MSKAPAIVRRIGTQLRLGPDGRVQGWIDPRPDLVGIDGALHFGALGCLADVVTGFACNQAVPDGQWVMTGDLSLMMTAPVVRGPARIEATVVRATASTVIADMEVVDEDLGRVVGGGSAGCRVRSAAAVGTGSTPIDVVVDHGLETDGVGLAEHLRLRREPGCVELDIRPDLTNPWDVLHGGVTFIAAVEAAWHAHDGAGRVGSVQVRYLSPATVGPIRFAESTVVASDPSLVRIVATDAGDGDRLVAHVDVVVFDR